MINRLFILLIGIVFVGCSNGKEESKDSFNQEFEEDLIELERLSESDEWKNVQPTGDEIQCPCCDYFTLGKREEYEICPICFWEDDGVNFDKLDDYSSPNHKTLRQGREDFIKYGACDSTMVKNVIKESERSKFILEKRYEN